MLFILHLILFYNILVEATSTSHCDPFRKLDSGAFVNGTCYNQLFQGNPDDYSFELYLYHGTIVNDFRDFVLLVGKKTAGEALDIRPDYYERLYDLVFDNSTRLPEEYLFKQNENDDINLVSWVKHSKDQYEGTLNEHENKIHASSYGIKTDAPEWADNMWEIMGSGSFISTQVSSIAANYFKSIEAQWHCRAAFIITNEKFNAINNLQTKTTPRLLLTILPNSKIGDCKTATSESTILSALIDLFKIVSTKAINTFCLSITGDDGWFGSNNWFGQLKFFNLDRQLSYSSIKC
ncbi:hypothetical protein DFJ63DRAFT_311966 [Scheffersomyces coipomensis]|uniref:uncharacterized protein n=1 Tax=Scheffersomyces coipomensis TaxID=1788519 RepID=UPI00315D59DC